MKNSHSTIETQYILAGSTRFAYRSFGNSSGVPLVFLQHFTGTMDNWDPLVTDGLAQSRQVILFNNAGVSNSSGKTPDNVPGMTNDAIAFIDALGLEKVGILGFSLGGFIAQQIAIERPAFVRKLILVGTGPKGSEGLEELPETLNRAMQKEPAEIMLYMFYADSETSRNAGLQVLQRFQQRTLDRDPQTSMEAITAQLKALVSWGAAKDTTYNDLKKISQPVLIVNGKNDIIIPVINSYTLYQQLANARLSLYADSAHGSLFQYADRFVTEVEYFLKED